VLINIYGFKNWKLLGINRRNDGADSSNIVTEKSVRKAVARSGRYNRERNSATWLYIYVATYY